MWGGNTTSITELGEDELVHVGLGVHVVGQASTPAGSVPVVHMPGETVVVVVAGVIVPYTEGVCGAKADLVVGRETEGPVNDAIPVSAMDAVGGGKSAVTTVAAVVAAREHTAGGSEGSDVVVVATVTSVLGSDEHPVVVGVPVTDHVAHVTTVLGSVGLVEAYMPAAENRFLDIMMNSNLGLGGSVADVRGFAGAERLVVLLIAIVERAVGVAANRGRHASLVTGSTVGDVVHVAGFCDLSGHLFGGH